MGRHPKPKGPETLGKGKVTPTQVAFIVDSYLCDNNFTDTRTAFRNEASSPIANSIHQAPKSLLSLGQMLDEYICLKEQKAMVERQMVLVEREKNCIKSLLQGLQNVMNAYNVGRSNVAPKKPAMANANSAAVVAAGIPQKCSNRITPPPGVSTTMQNTPAVYSLPQPTNNTNAENANFSTPLINGCDRKRKDTIIVLDSPSAVKKSRGNSSNWTIPLQGQNTMPQSDNAASGQIVARPSYATHISPGNYTTSGSQAQGSAVAKCLFNQPPVSVPTINSPVLETPIIRENSSHADIYKSPPDISSVSASNGEVEPTCYTLISTKRVMVSPAKQMAYIERSQCISSLVKMDSDKISKREHVRSILDFDASKVPGNLDKSLPAEIPASESAKEVDLFDSDFPNLDALGVDDFSLTEMLRDLEIPYEGIDFSYNPATDLPK